MKTFNTKISVAEANSLNSDSWGVTFKAPFNQASEVLKIWGERRRYRSELRRLQNVGSHMIRDIGMTLEEALGEAAKPFWRG